WPHYSVYHNTTSPLSTQEFVTPNQLVELPENYNGTPAGYYVADIDLVVRTYANEFSPTTQILHGWGRYANVVGYDFENPLTDIQSAAYTIVPYGNYDTVITATYCYHLIEDIGMNSLDVWVPSPPSDLKTPYSLHLYDPNATGLENI